MGYQPYAQEVIRGSNVRHNGAGSFTELFGKQVRRLGLGQLFSERLWRHSLKSSSLQFKLS